MAAPAQGDPFAIVTGSRIEVRGATTTAKTLATSAGDATGVGTQAAPAAPVELHYASCGDAGKPLLLMLHGFPQCWFAWAAMMPRFAQRYHVVAPDLRGFNLSSKPRGVESYRPRELVKDVATLIPALGHSQATIVAHDWGGAIAWNLAIARPDLVERLIILNAPHPVPFARALAHDPAQQKASAYMNWLRAPDSEVALAENDFSRMDRLFTGFGAAQAAHWFDEPTRRRYHEAWSQPGALRAMVNWYRASPLYPPSGSDPGAGRLTLAPADFFLRVPTRVIWGMDDPALLPLLLDGLEDLGDDLRITRLAGLTHWLVHEAPDQVAQSIEESLVA